MKTNETQSKISDGQMDVYLAAGCGQITERKWSAKEESNAGTIAILDKSAGIGGWAAGAWVADARGGWLRA